MIDSSQNAIVTHTVKPLLKWLPILCATSNHSPIEGFSIDFTSIKQTAPFIKQKLTASPRVAVQKLFKTNS